MARPTASMSREQAPPWLRIPFDADATRRGVLPELCALPRERFGIDHDTLQLESISQRASHNAHLRSRLSALAVGSRARAATSTAA